MCDTGLKGKQMAISWFGWANFTSAPRLTSGKEFILHRKSDDLAHVHPPRGVSRKKMVLVFEAPRIFRNLTFVQFHSGEALWWVRVHLQVPFHMLASTFVSRCDRVNLQNKARSSFGCVVLLDQPDSFFLWNNTIRRMSKSGGPTSKSEKNQWKYGQNWEAETTGPRAWNSKMHH